MTNFKEYQRVSSVLFFIFFILLLFFMPNKNEALQKLPPGLNGNFEEGEIVVVPSCDLDVRFFINLRESGFMVPGVKTFVEALNPRIIFDIPQLGGGCNSSSSNFNEKFEWAVIDRPPGSNAVLEETNTFKPYIIPDKGGDYIVRFTACPGGCEYVMQNGVRLIAGPNRTEITLHISDDAVIPPATEPIEPPVDIQTPKTVFTSACSGGLINPQWTTVEHWDGPQDYHLLEGHVNWSHISRKDNFLNHDSQDFLMGVDPDPAYQYLLGSGIFNMESIEVEWERASFPEGFRPTRGDRVSVIGYWVRDCGHDGNPEIHPPVLVASHRARPVRVNGYGSNVRVPGIITDLWVNQQAGEITRNCSQTGLHNVLDSDTPVESPLDLFTCLPQTAGFTTNPINRLMQFNIYLPKNPREIYRDAGLTVPPQLPLSIEVYNPNGSGGPDPVIIPHIEDGYLEVQVDLRTYSGSNYSRKIESAWVLPSPRNWDLAAWQCTINTLDVHDDGDNWISGGDGDWRFWVNLNNGAKEWVKLYDCNGCVHGQIEYGNTPWVTASGNPAGNRSLGPDVLLYPGQFIWFHSSGFEADEIWDDYTGEVNRLMPQVAGEYAIQSNCTDSGQSNCCSYTIHYEISPGNTATRPSLNGEGIRLFNSYKVRYGPYANIEFPATLARFWNHPLTDSVLPDSVSVQMDDETYFPVQEAEPSSIAEMSNEVFARELQEIQKKNPKAFLAFIGELREEITVMQKSENKDDAELALQSLKVAVPKDIWKAHFSDVKLPGDQWITGISNNLLLVLAAILLLILAFLAFRKTK
ncbi:MAG: hypothetical protein KDC34_14715 [Saprospiraceae bacterium]|nr:hypothetical protein [Saprospiraceae bacterium]